MNTYLGITRAELEDSYNYDRELGKVFSKRSGKEIGCLGISGLYTSKRHKGSLLCLSLGKLCYFLNTNTDLDAGSKVSYLDGDCYNLRPSNLELVGRVRHVPIPKKEKVVTVVVEEGIRFNPKTGEYYYKPDRHSKVIVSMSKEEAVRSKNNYILSSKESCC